MVKESGKIILYSSVPLLLAASTPPSTDTAPQPQPVKTQYHPSLSRVPPVKTYPPVCLEHRSNCTQFRLCMYVSTYVRTNHAGRLLAGCGLSTIFSGPSANRNSHAVPSGRAMPRATPGNRTRMAESIVNELTPRRRMLPHTCRGATSADTVSLKAAGLQGLELRSFEHGSARNLVRTIELVNTDPGAHQTGLFSSAADAPSDRSTLARSNDGNSD